MNPVQQKISCVYITGVSDEASSKRSHQAYKVSATRDLTEQAQRDNIDTAIPTEKLDGTCCLIQEFQGQPWLWARHDRKPSKVGERKFAQYKKSREKGGPVDADVFTWDPSKDFKEAPTNWIPASGLEVKDGVVIPDTIGHTPGWVPVELTSRQHCWHLSAVDLSQGVALILRKDKDSENSLVLESQPISSMCGQTCELIGTNINANPYGLGTKKCPLHILVPHGSLHVTCPSPSDFDAMYSWFEGGEMAGRVEGVVWHCANGQLHKLHRHHLNIKWPISEPRLCQMKVKVQVEVTASEGQEEGLDKGKGQGLFSKLSNLNGQVFGSLKDMHEALVGDDGAAS